MGLLLGEVTWGEHAVFPHNKGMKGKKFDWLLEFGFNWLYSYHCQHSKQPVWAEGCWLVKVHYFAFIYLFRAVQYKVSTRDKQESLLQKAGEQAVGQELPKEWVWVTGFCLGFLNIFFPDAPQLCLRKQFDFVYLLVVWIICAEERSTISRHFLIAEDCHFQ